MKVIKLKEKPSLSEVSHSNNTQSSLMLYFKVNRGDTKSQVILEPGFNITADIDDNGTVQGLELIPSYSLIEEKSLSMPSKDSESKIRLKDLDEDYSEASSKFYHDEDNKILKVVYPEQGKVKEQIYLSPKVAIGINKDKEPVEITMNYNTET